jgi:hypothetical protein
MATETVSSITRPAPFIEAAGKNFLDELQKAVGQFKTADLAKVFGPQFVAGQGQFKSPYQQDVIDTTLREFDVQAAKGLPALRAKAIGAGAFGGGREGVQLAEFQATSDRNRAALQAQLQQQGFQQAQTALQQALGNQIGLAKLAPQLAAGEISGLTTLGGLQQSQAQAGLTAQQQLAQQQLNQPLTAAQALGQGVSSLIAGYPGQVQQEQVVVPSLAQTALGAGATLAGIYRAFS